MRRQVCILSALGPALRVACARLKQQTDELEPHGLVCLTGHPDPTGGNGVVNKIDGLPLRAGREYCVTPGPHTITVLFMNTVVEVHGARAGARGRHQGAKTWLKEKARPC